MNSLELVKTRPTEIRLSQQAMITGDTVQLDKEINRLCQTLTLLCKLGWLTVEEHTDVCNSDRVLTLKWSVANE